MTDFSFLFQLTIQNKHIITHLWWLELSSWRWFESVRERKRGRRNVYKTLRSCLQWNLFGLLQSFDFTASVCVYRCRITNPGQTSHLWVSQQSAWERISLITVIFPSSSTLYSTPYQCCSNQIIRSFICLYSCCVISQTHLLCIYFKWKIWI